MMKVYVIKQILQYNDKPFYILFGYTTSYEVVRWFGQNRQLFYNHVTVEEWNVSSEVELWALLTEQFELEGTEKPELFYLELRDNILGTVQKPIYTNQSIDVSSYAFTKIDLAMESIEHLVYQMLCMRVETNQVGHIIRCIRLIWKYLMCDDDGYGYNGIQHLDDVSVLIDMIDNDEDGHDGYYGY